MILGARWKPIEAQWPRLDAIAYAHDVKLEALRLLGAMLKATTRATGGDAQRTRFQKGMESPPTIKELGLDYKISLLAQRVANLSPEKFKDVQASVVTLAKMTQPLRGTLGTGENEWYTPPAHCSLRPRA